MDTAKPIRILIADDHAVVRKGLAMVLKLDDEFEVVGEASTGKEALDLTAELNPDLVILDLIMPVMNGQEAAAQLSQRFPETKKIILTGTEIDENTLDALETGIDGYVLKEIEPGQLKEAIRAVMAGETFLHPTITQLLVQQSRSHRETSNPKTPLTPREMEVLQWFGTSKTYRQIAEKLNVSEETIRSHAKSILNKLEQPNRGQAALAAIRLGLMDMPE